MLKEYICFEQLGTGQGELLVMPVLKRIKKFGVIFQTDWDLSFEQEAFQCGKTDALIDNFWQVDRWIPGLIIF